MFFQMPNKTVEELTLTTDSKYWEGSPVELSGLYINLVFKLEWFIDKIALIYVLDNWNYN